MKTLSVLVFCLLVASCASITAGPVLVSEPIFVENIEEYWVSQHDKQPIKFNKRQLKALFESPAYVVATYLIDSNGDIYNVEIKEASHPVLFDDLVKRSLQKRKFLPAEGNTARVPVYNRSRLDFNL